LSLIFSLQQNRRIRGPNRFCLEAGGGRLGGLRRVERGGVKLYRTKYRHIHINTCTYKKMSAYKIPNVNNVGGSYQCQFPDFVANSMISQLRETGL
jgi:hypothetical protein